MNDVSVSDVRVRNLWWRDVPLQHRRVRDVPVQAVCLPNVCLQNFSRLKCPCKGCLSKSCHFAFVRKVIMWDLCLQDCGKMFYFGIIGYKMSTCDMSVRRMSMCGMSLYKMSMRYTSVLRCQRVVCLCVRTQC